jgi:hypothetical protein
MARSPTRFNPYWYRVADLLGSRLGQVADPMIEAPPSYKKPPHECKGLYDCFGRGFFEGSINVKLDCKGLTLPISEFVLCSCGFLVYPP